MLSGARSMTIERLDVALTPAVHPLTRLHCRVELRYLLLLGVCALR